MTVLEESIKEKSECVNYELLQKLVAMIADGRCTIEDAREELELNPQAFIEKILKDM